MKSIFTAAIALAVSTTAFAQNPIVAAKDLYTNAAYEDALSTLAGVESGAPPEILRQADEYRAYCLFALGRTAEAEAVAEAMIRKDPQLALDASAASPRIEAMFVAVTKRLLPGMIRAEYRAARSAFDQKNAAEAEPHLAGARRMLDQAKALGTWDESLADLNELVEGFIELARAQHAARPSPPHAPDAAAAPSTSGPNAVVAPARSAEVSTTPTAFSAGDDDVIPPTVIRQLMPPTPPGLLSIMRANGKQGLLEVVIDENGSVRSATMRQSINNVFDALVVNAAQDWRYRPARRNGVPVPYVKMVMITAEPTKE